MDLESPEPGTPPTWRVLRQRSSATLLQSGALVCVHFRGPSTVEEIAADFEAQNSVVEQYGAISQVVLFEADKIGRIGHLTKDKAVEQLAKWGNRLRGSAIVVMGGGLAGRFIRVTIAGALALSPGTVQQRVFRTVEDGVDWLKTLEGQHESVLRAETQQLRRLIGL